MLRRVNWILATVLLTVVSFPQPWSSAEAGSGSKPPPALAAACKDTRAQLADAEARLARLEQDNRQLQRELTALLDAEHARAKRLADQLGAPMIEHLH